LSIVPPEGLAPDRQPATLVVVEEDPLAAELLAEDAVLLAEVLDGLVLLLAEPAGEDGREDLEDRVHGAKVLVSGRVCVTPT
jgi:hypothetical protein